MCGSDARAWLPFKEGSVDQRSGVLSVGPQRGVRMLFSNRETQTGHRRLRMWFGFCSRAAPPGTILIPGPDSLLCTLAPREPPQQGCHVREKGGALR